MRGLKATSITCANDQPCLFPYRVEYLSNFVLSLSSAISLESFGQHLYLEQKQETYICLWSTSNQTSNEGFGRRIRSDNNTMIY